MVSASPNQVPQGRRSAFTLIEVLVAIALSALVLTAASILLATMSELWHQRRAGDPFTEHVSGLRTFLQTLVDRSVLEQEAGDASPAGAAARWSHPPGYPDFDPPYLNFAISDPPAVLTAGGPALPALEAWLAPVPREGLFLIFRSRLIEGRETDDLRFRLLSPYFDSIAYGAYDAERDAWEETTEPPLDASRNITLPAAVLLNFKLGEQAEQIVLHLPPSSRVPLP